MPIRFTKKEDQSPDRQRPKESHQEEFILSGPSPVTFQNSPSKVEPEQLATTL